MLNSTGSNTGGSKHQEPWDKFDCQSEEKNCRSLLSEEEKKRVRRLLATERSEHARLKVGTAGTTV